MINLKKHIHNLRHTRERNALLHFICVLIFYMVRYGYWIWVDWDKSYWSCSFPTILFPLWFTIFAAPLHLFVCYLLKKMWWAWGQYLKGWLIIYALIFWFFVSLYTLLTFVGFLYNKLPAIQSILYPLFAILSFEKAISINGLISGPMMIIW